MGEMGMSDKVLEVRPPYEFVPEHEISADNPRQKLADNRIMQAADRNMFGAELLWWCRLLFPTLPIGNSRHMMPRPRVFSLHEAEANETTDKTCFAEWLLNTFEHCDIHEAMKDHGARIKVCVFNSYLVFCKKYYLLS
jgi:hypothetical protein